jgi:ribosomal protein S18 acetylase RimI-like enzyme
VWIAMMLVDPEKRRQGIGKGLMEEAMRAVEEAPCVGLDASLSGEPLYRGFGFVSHSRSVRMKTSITSVRVAAHPESVRRMERADLPAVLQLDRGVFGADRGRLLASLFERAPECAWVAADAHALRGYVMGRPGHLYHQVGPVVAPDIGTARALVARCCSELNGRQAAIDATRFDAEWMQSLGSLGFVEERPFIRMFRGADVQPGLTGQQYAIAGPEFA